ncbi:MAG: hypothetical protein HQL55_15815 [Magnetococcales bacterium]|nr:hypothetical protein [Magnetococcales bacterium]
MSQPLLELQRLLAGRASATGRVISMGDGMARVATSGGVVEVAADTGIQVGDPVMVRNGRAVKSQGVADVPVFLV